MEPPIYYTYDKLESRMESVPHHVHLQLLLLHDVSVRRPREDQLW